MRRRLGMAALLAAGVGGIAALLILIFWSDGMGLVPKQPQPPTSGRAIPIAVLGDSNSQSYHDDTWFPPHERGGPLRASTFQWTEVLARLRGSELDMGPWVR